MRKENENKQDRQKSTNMECADEFGKKTSTMNPTEKHRDIEIGSETRQQKENFEFGRDNYFNTNGNMNNFTNHNINDRSNSSYELDSLRDKNLEDAYEYEFADDLYATSNNLNNQRNQSDINEKGNKNQKR